MIAGHSCLRKLESLLPSFPAQPVNSRQDISGSEFFEIAQQQVTDREPVVLSFNMAEIAKIPVIDISGDNDQTQVAKELVEAAIEHGFVYIKNTGKDIPVDVIDAAFDMVTEQSSPMPHAARHL
jgi:hypothetical protein